MSVDIMDFRYVDHFAYIFGRMIVVPPSPIGYNVVILTNSDFSKFLVVSLDMELFCRNDIDDSLDRIPFGLCPYLGTLLVVDDQGNVITSWGDIVYEEC